MSISLHEIYDKIEAQSNEDLSQFIPKDELLSLDKYKSLQRLKDIINSLNKERTSDINNNTICRSHRNFSIIKNNISLTDVNRAISKIAKQTCSTKDVKTCSCETLDNCTCNTRTLTCDSVLSYSVSPFCESRTTTSSSVSAICSSRTTTRTDVSCECNSQLQTGYVGGYVYEYYYYYQTTGTAVGYVANCSLHKNMYGLSAPICGCNAAYGYAAGYVYYYYATYCSSRTTTSTKIECDCESRTTYSTKTTCNCESRTTTNACACNTRSEGLCKSRTGCSCDQVCQCNSVKDFGSNSSNKYATSFYSPIFSYINYSVCSCDQVCKCNSVLYYTKGYTNYIDYYETATTYSIAGSGGYYYLNCTCNQIRICRCNSVTSYVAGNVVYSNYFESTYGIVGSEKVITSYECSCHTVQV